MAWVVRNEERNSGLRRHALHKLKPPHMLFMCMPSKWIDYQPFISRVFVALFTVYQPVMLPHLTQVLGDLDNLPHFRHHLRRIGKKRPCLELCIDIWSLPWTALPTLNYFSWDELIHVDRIKSFSRIRATYIYNITNLHVIPYLFKLDLPSPLIVYYSPRSVKTGLELIFVNSSFEYL